MRGGTRVMLFKTPCRPPENATQELHRAMPYVTCRCRRLLSYRAPLQGYRLFLYFHSHGASFDFIAAEATLTYAAARGDVCAMARSSDEALRSAAQRALQRDIAVAFMPPIVSLIFHGHYDVYFLHFRHIACRYFLISCHLRRFDFRRAY